MKEPPDVMVSGINHGSNTAINIIYSGTVSAAREAAIMDVPSIAISVTNHAAKDFRFAAQIAKMLILKIAGKNLPPGTLLNVNVPDLPEEKIAGILLTKQSKSKWDDVYEQRQDPYGKDYYWLTGNLMEVDNEIESDQAAIRKNYVSVTPIHFDLTDYETFERMKSWNIERLFDEKENRNISN
jgi:5'-nucleotidase